MRPRILVALVVLSAVAGARPAEANFVPASITHAIRPVTRAIDKGMLVTAVKTRAALDHTETSLRVAHPKLAQALGATRRTLKPLSPGRIAGFAAARVKKNPLLVPAYLSVSLPLDAGRLYAAATLPPEIAGPLYVLSSVPGTVLALFSAEHITHTLHGERPSLQDTMRGLASDYSAYNARQDERIDRAARAMK